MFTPPKRGAFDVFVVFDASAAVSFGGPPNANVFFSVPAAAAPNVKPPVVAAVVEAGAGEPKLNLAPPAAAPPPKEKAGAAGVAVVPLAVEVLVAPVPPPPPKRPPKVTALGLAALPNEKPPLGAFVLDAVLPAWPKENAGLLSPALVVAGLPKLNAILSCACFS